MISVQPKLVASPRDQAFTFGPFNQNLEQLMYWNENAVIDQGYHNRYLFRRLSELRRQFRYLVHYLPLIRQCIRSFG